MHGLSKFCKIKKQKSEPMCASESGECAALDNGLDQVNEKNSKMISIPKLLTETNRNFRKVRRDGWCSLKLANLHLSGRFSVRESRCLVESSPALAGTTLDAMCTSTEFSATKWNICETFLKILQKRAKMDAEWIPFNGSNHFVKQLS